MWGDKNKELTLKYAILLTYSDDLFWSFLGMHNI